MMFGGSFCQVLNCVLAKFRSPPNPLIASVIFCRGSFNRACTDCHTVPFGRFMIDPLYRHRRASKGYVTGFAIFTKSGQIQYSAKPMPKTPFPARS